MVWSTLPLPLPLLHPPLVSFSFLLFSPPFLSVYLSVNFTSWFCPSPLRTKAASTSNVTANLQEQKKQNGSHQTIAANCWPDRQTLCGRSVSLSLSRPPLLPCGHCLHSAESDPYWHIVHICPSSQCRSVPWPLPLPLLLLRRDPSHSTLLECCRMVEILPVCEATGAPPTSVTL